MNILRNRQCWCGETLLREILTVQFVDVFGLEEYQHRIAQCQQCGSILSRDAVSEEIINAYYAEHDLYNQFADDLREAEGSRNKTLRQIQDSRPFITNGDLVLDIGCATGLTLDYYRREGCSIFGTELSSSSIQYSYDHYGIQPIRCSVYDIQEYFTRQSFDFVSCSHVLEHLYDPLNALKQIAIILKDNGFLYIEVPDLSSYLDYTMEPFAHIDIEHVNYFSKHSLSQLLTSLGFEIKVLKTVSNGATIKPYFPAIVCICRKSDLAPVPYHFQPVDGEIMSAYREASLESLRMLNKIFAPLIDSQVPIAIWCAGKYTARLLAMTDAAKLNIVQIVDGAPSRQGKHLRGYVIQSPERLSHKATHVLVSTGSFGKDINDILRAKFPKKTPINLVGSVNEHY